jgi:hypothetical protein
LATVRSRQSVANEVHGLELNSLVVFLRYKALLLHLVPILEAVKTEDSQPALAKKALRKSSSAFVLCSFSCFHRERQSDGLRSSIDLDSGEMT